ncbi:glutamate synthase large subunit [Prochlorococcus marinus]|uniref:glutamate synthase large subunit n=1 Tax=Prochlorococcus marinus TaxID=1219 RepID=UPI00019009D0|nr:glutamate synthase large subunit [Prochlorococcus marinus]EEE40919.1 glutamate synthase domain family protein [Prochlorococcus marinus str. MIT 9202]
MGESIKRIVGPYQDSYSPNGIIGEKDACGVGFIANVNGIESNWILKQSLKGLNCMEHRGGCGGDSDSGDGAGILCSIPWNYLEQDVHFKNKKEYEKGLGMVFMPHEKEKIEECKSICEKEAEKLSINKTFWRKVPVNNEILGPLAKANAPFICQWILYIDKKDHPDIERLLFQLRKRIEKKIIETFKNHVGDCEFYFASLSSQTVVYKGMVRSEVLSEFYQDLKEESFKVSFSVYHRRFSTNTLPKWPLAQPMRFLGHNGEINTLLGNINWAKASETHIDNFWGELSNEIKPIVDVNKSDSSNLDATLEINIRSGQPITDSLLKLVPEAFREQPEIELRANIKAFYEYSATLQEAWDGPALLVFTDGNFIGATLDRNGLRPARYSITNDGFVIMGSETGVVDLVEEKIIEKGRLGPGQMLAVDFNQNRILRNWEVKSEAAQRHDYQNLLTNRTIKIENNEWITDCELKDLELLQQQTAYGFSAEDNDLILDSMASLAKEPTYCMGDDIPLAVLSSKPHILYDYFKQRFAQVTNPPIDPLREKLVMSLEMHLGERCSPFKVKDAKPFIHLKSPILNEKELFSIKKSEIKSQTISTLFEINEGIKGFEGKLHDICEQSGKAVNNGCSLIIISDKGISSTKSFIPPLLAVGAIHHYLLKKEIRLKASLIIETGQCWSTHHLACLIGYGVSAVCPWLIFESGRHWLKHPKTQKLIESKKIDSLSTDQVQTNIKKALEDGLRKILSKIGISLLSSYHGAQIFEAVGLGSDLINLGFDGTTSRIAGITLKELANESISIHTKAYPEIDLKKLEFLGFVQFRNYGEYHSNNPEMSKALHSAVKKGPGYEHFKLYKELITNRPTTALRDLLTIDSNRESIPINEVESVESICKRFCTGGMSLGALSREAHEVLAVAMNRIGGKSNSGEGGEDPARFNVLNNIDENTQSATLPFIKGLKNGDTACSAIKQIASGRFGVTPEYLRSGKQLEIKMAQGAKPGEGGQLPGPKVDSYIAKLRNSKPGVALISPPPHHDIYSIEDLAQLIHDLHQVHPKAKVSVKLVSEIGIGTIAAGVSKANADVIQISGHDGGTGASPLSSIKHAGLPWELGLAEVHKSLLDNNLRDRVLLRTDGGLKTGWDVVIAALLGAEEYGFGSVAMIAEGCVMARVCHKNTCPVGVATQKEELRKRFKGLPDNVVNFFIYIAEEIRQILSTIGVKTMEEIIGNKEFLTKRNISLPKTENIDLTSLVNDEISYEDRSWIKHSNNAHSNGTVLEDSILTDAQFIDAVTTHGEFSKKIEIKNTDRSVCAKISGELAQHYGNKGFEGAINLIFNGHAGQSFGAFLLKGMIIKLIGEANDYVCKGMNGGILTIIPPRIDKNSSEQVILGNTCLYGATGGKLYALGKSGERFAVRNSGAVAVTEGAGDHCCEYMTGGIIVILGSTGRNIGAGMTGGVAFILDEKNDLEKKVNKEIVSIYEIKTPKQEQILLEIINEYHDNTQSPKAATILKDWINFKNLFKVIIPPSELEMLGLRNQ